MSADPFPHQTQANFVPLSAATEEYSCFSWALHVTNQVIWPDEDSQHAWPLDMPRDETPDAFRAFCEHAGFEVCANAVQEAGYEKIAFYTKDGLVRHVARLQENGRWTSKMGEGADGEHPTTETFEGPGFGYVTLFMRRPQTGAPPILPELYPKPPILITPTGGRLL